MSGRNGKMSATRWLLPVAAGALAVLAYGLWQGFGGEPEPGAAGGPPEGSPAKETSGPPDDGQQTDTRAETGPPKTDEPVAPETPAEKQAHEILAEMRQTWDCYQSPQCRLGDAGDPRAEYFEAGRRIAAGMRALIRQHRNHRIGDEQLGRAAHQVLAYDSGRARAAAIEALGRLPAVGEHLDALTRALDQHHDEKLFALAMPELKRYAERGHRAEVDAFLQSNLRFGAHFPARTIARELGPLLTPDNIGAYEELARELPPDTPRAEALRQTLETYRKRH